MKLPNDLAKRRFVAVLEPQHPLDVAVFQMLKRDHMYGAHLPAKSALVWADFAQYVPVKVVNDTVGAASTDLVEIGVFFSTPIERTRIRVP